MALLCVTSVGGLSSVPGFCSNIPRGSTFEATVDDGTPRSLHARQSVEEDVNEESLEEYASEQRHRRHPARKPVVISEEASDRPIKVSTEVSIPAQPQQPGAEDVAALKAEIAALKAQIKAPEDLAKARTAGDKIDANHVKDIALRLKYTNEIVRRFGIAYDYRVMTVKDFKRILAKLEAQEKQAEQ